MKESSGLLDQVRVASPCAAKWDTMDGDDRSRHCRECRLQVYNLSAMSRAEAEALVLEKEGRLCVRFHQRRDGTVLTQDCPVGRSKARRWLAGQLAGIGGVFGILAVLAPLARADTLRRLEAFRKIRHSHLAQVQPFQSLFELIDPEPPVVMGVMIVPNTPISAKMRGSSGS